MKYDEDDVVGSNESLFLDVLDSALSRLHRFDTSLVDNFPRDFTETGDDYCYRSDDYEKAYQDAVQETGSIIAENEFIDSLFRDRRW